MIMRLTALEPPPPTPMTCTHCSISKGRGGGRIICWPERHACKSAMCSICQCKEFECGVTLMEACWAAKGAGLAAGRSVLAAGPAGAGLESKCGASLKARMIGRPLCLHHQSRMKQTQIAIDRRQPGLGRPADLLPDEGIRLRTLASRVPCWCKTPFCPSRGSACMPFIAGTKRAGVVGRYVSAGCQDCTVLETLVERLPKK